MKLAVASVSLRHSGCFSQQLSLNSDFNHKNRKRRSSCGGAGGLAAGVQLNWSDICVHELIQSNKCKAAHSSLAPRLHWDCFDSNGRRCVTHPRRHTRSKHTWVCMPFCSYITGFTVFGVLCPRTLSAWLANE